MRILLDENFPLALLWKLQEEGHEVDHIIVLGLRGASDRAIIDRLNSEDLLLLTNDQEFLGRPLTRSRVIVSRVTQSQPIAVRVEIWLKAIREYFSRDWDEAQFEIFDDGKLRPWQKLPPRSF
jgi:predicted nuclease of predicted toxin-antitoxin system